MRFNTVEWLVILWGISLLGVIISVICSQPQGIWAFAHLFSSFSIAYCILFNFVVFWKKIKKTDNSEKPENRN